MQLFTINKTISIVCIAENTRSGFRHIARLMINGIERDMAKACYQNRTWERFTYETVLSSLINKTSELTAIQKKLTIKKTGVGHY